MALAVVGVLVDGAIRLWWVVGIVAVPGAAGRAHLAARGSRSAGLFGVALGDVAEQVVRRLAGGVVSGGSDRRRLPVRFVWVWVVLVVSRPGWS